VVLTIGTILAFVFLDWPWRALVVLGLLAFEGLEIALFLKLRKMRTIIGAEAMAGEVGQALTDCKPNGQVKLKGQVWKARCPQGVDAGAEVIVTKMEGIFLEVAPK
jgi:membrane-bound serine protease (ClpP class)